MSHMKLYVFSLSGHAHRAQLFLSLLGTQVELIEVNLAAGEHKQDEFLAINSFGQVPVLVDGDVIISDSNAILTYIAMKEGRTDWYPQSPEAAAAVQKWLTIAAGLLAFGPAAARLITVFNASFNAEEVIARAHHLLGLMEDELEGQNWIIGGAQPTIADVALYSYIARAPEGNVDLSPYVNVRNWLDRIEGLDGFVPFAQTAVGLAAAA